MHDEFPGGLPDSDLELVVGAHAACKWMNERKSPAPSPVFDYIDALSRELPEGYATSFGMNAASAYCPNMWNQKNPAHW